MIVQFEIPKNKGIRKGYQSQNLYKRMIPLWVKTLNQIKRQNEVKTTQSRNTK